MPEGRGGGEEAAGEGGTGDGCGGRGGRHAGKHARHPGGGGEAQAVEELRRALADVRRRTERVERAERDSERQEQRGQGGEEAEGCPPLRLFRQPGIAPEAEQGVQQRRWDRIRHEAARLKESNREVAERDRRVREEEEAAALRGHQVIPDPERDIAPYR